MHWERVRVEMRGSWRGQVPMPRDGTVTAGPFEVEVRVHDAGEWAVTEWSLANTSELDVAVESVALVHRLEAGAALRLFANGYQSWSPTGLRRFGIDQDPSVIDRSPSLLRAFHHADQRVAVAGALRSEAVAVLADDGPERLLVGFDAGTGHDGTVWLRPGPNGPELVMEAYLGGAELAAGTRRELHAVVTREGPDASELLEAWAALAGSVQHARTGAAYQVGWCSWYHYFHDISEAALRANLAAAAGWPFDVFQLDDGFQASIGDWLDTNDRFPSDLAGLADTIASAGYRPGLWIAPFLVAPDSEVVRRHPEWVARHRSGDELVGHLNPGWGGLVWTLDTTRSDVLDHLEQVAASLVDAGFTYLKLDFTYAPSIDGLYEDRSLTPAQRVRAGFDAIRRGAGDDAFLLGCGAPLGCTVGVVDGMRIGPDVAPAWEPQPMFPAYGQAEPATSNAWRNTLARSFMHRRLWLNDPDCLMLRTRETAMTPAAVEAWAWAVGVSGGMALVSDDLALLDDPARRLLDEVLELGRASDAEAAAGRPPRCEDLLEHETPGRLRSSAVALDADPDTPVARLLRDD